MTKAEIVNAIARETGIEKTTVQAVVEGFMDQVKESLAKGAANGGDSEHNVYLRGFGSFIVKHRAQKAARNIKQKTTLTIPAHYIPAFKPAKTFAAELKDEK